jgi:hypothetical protein
MSVQAMTRTELYHSVDLAFYERFPDAPRQLGASSRRDWREWWIAERDRQLAEEVNRVYWARYPDAPIQLDETSPEWEPWREVWRGIWQEVMDNAPEPEDVPIQSAVDSDGNLDLSYARAGIRESAVDIANDHDWTVDDRDKLIEAAEPLLDDVARRAMSGDPSEFIYSDEERVSGLGQTITFRVMGWWGPGYFYARLSDVTTHYDSQ